jgi:hypothetical protein
MKRKVHLKNPINPEFPYCAARVDMKDAFQDTEDEKQVTCRLCLMRMGVIEDTRGNWDNRNQ